MEDIFLFVYKCYKQHPHVLPHSSSLLLLSDRSCRKREEEENREVKGRQRYTEERDEGLQSVESSNKALENHKLNI